MNATAGLAGQGPSRDNQTQPTETRPLKPMLETIQQEAAQLSLDMLSLTGLQTEAAMTQTRTEDRVAEAWTVAQVTGMWPVGMMGKVALKTDLTVAGMITPASCCAIR